MTNAKILIVQGDDSGAADLEKRLQGLGYAVCASVGGGRQAIEQAAAMRPDLVLIDLGLEGEVNGIGVAEQVGRQFDIPVIYLTDDAEGDLLQQAQQTNPFGYVLKPVDARQLHLNIKTALARRERENEYRENESELQHRTQLLENIFDSINEGIVAIDENGKYLIFNTSAKDMFGIFESDLPLDQRSEYYGFFLQDRVSPFPNDDLPLSRAALNGESLVSEIFVHNPEMADDCIVSASATPIRCAAGQLRGGGSLMSRHHRGQRSKSENGTDHQRTGRSEPTMGNRH